MSTRQISRRHFLKAAGLTVAFSTLAACAPKVLPTAVPPTEAPKPAAPQPTAAPTVAASQPTAAPQPTVAQPTQVAAPAPAQQVTIKTCDLVAEDTKGAGVFVKVCYEEFADLFPNIKVDHLPYPDVGLEKRKEYWMTGLGQGGYDVVRLQTNKWAWEFAAVGRTLYLDEYIPLYYQDDWASLHDVVKNLCSYEGHPVMIPGGVEFHGMVVRRDYLKECGYEETYVPKTWPEFSKMIKDLTTDKYYGFQWKTYMRAMSEFLHMNGGDFATEAPDKTITLHFQDQETVEVCEYLKSFIYPERYIQKDTLQDFAGNLNAFQQGQGAVFNMVPSWTNWLFSPTEFGPEDLNYFCYPMGTSGVAGTSRRKPYVDIGCYGWVCNPYSSPEQKNAAAQYVSWMFGKENIKKQVKWWDENEIKGAFASPFKDVPWTSVSSGLPEWWAAPVDEMLSIGDADPAPDYQGYDYFMAGVAKMIIDQNSDVKAILAESEEITKREWMDEYHKTLKA